MVYLEEFNLFKTVSIWNTYDPLKGWSPVAVVVFETVPLTVLTCDSGRTCPAEFNTVPAGTDIVGLTIVNCPN